MPWDPAQYLKFADHRLRPAVDLLGRVDLAAPGEVYDLGAGAGNVTRLIKARWPEARVTGVDSSAEMLAKAAAAEPAIRWAAGRPRHAGGRRARRISSTRTRRCTGSTDHARLFPALLGGLAPGGVLAVQMPRNFSAPSHTLIAEAARGGPWRAPARAAAPALAGGAIPPSTTTCWRRTPPRSTSGRRSTSRCSRATIR